MKKTEFGTHHELFCYIRMPFGLNNIPATLQRADNVILASVKWKFAFVYIDDIIIISRPQQQHLEHADEELRWIKEAGMTIKLKIANFSRSDRLFGTCDWPEKTTGTTKSNGSNSCAALPYNGLTYRIIFGHMQRL